MNGIEKFEGLRDKLISRKTMIRVRFRGPNNKECLDYGLYLGYKKRGEDLTFQTTEKYENTIKKKSIIDFDIIEPTQLIGTLNALTEIARIIKEIL